MIDIKENRCDFCGACISVCPVDCIEVRESSIEIDNKTCIDCDLCRQEASANFQRNEDAGYYYVYKQPENEQEEAECQRALEECPVEAIGDFGNK